MSDNTIWNTDSDWNSAVEIDQTQVVSGSVLLAETDDEVLYYEGTGDWQEGYMNGDSANVYESDNSLFAEVIDEPFGGTATWVTQDQYDLSDVDALNINWRNQGSSTDDILSVVSAISDPGDNPDTSGTKIHEVEGGFDWSSDRVPVGVTGSHYIAFASIDDGGGAISDVQVDEVILLK